MKPAFCLNELKIELTGTCPLGCLHCSSDAGPDVREAIQGSRAGDLVREFASLGGKRLALSGGEPLHYDGLPSILRIASQSHLDVCLYTSGVAARNGCLHPITDSILALLQENAVSVVFSLHGARAHTHDWITQRAGSFRCTMTAIERAVEAGLLVEVHVVPMAPNLAELADMVVTLGSMGVRRVSWLRFVPHGRGNKHRRRLDLGPRQLSELAKLRQQINGMRSRITLRTGAPFNILLPEIATPCKAGLSELIVRPDGQAMPCDAFKRFSCEDGFSSILDHSLQEVWHRSSLLQDLRMIHEAGPSPACKACSSFANCHSGCIGQTAIAAGGLVRASDPKCPRLFAEAICGKVETAAVC